MLAAKPWLPLYTTVNTTHGNLFPSLNDRLEASQHEELEWP